MEFQHQSVLLEEVVDGLRLRSGGLYVDGTLGGAGHSRALLDRVAIRLIGIDQDQEALAAAKARLAPYEGRVTLAHANFAELGKVLDDLGVSEVDGILLDIGVSSHQLDVSRRGFSYQKDAPLDMRMDQGQPLTAAQLVNEASEEELARIIWEYGEERWAKRIAQFIVEKRPLATTGQLADAIKGAIPAGARREGPHPAKRTFQALRIAVNDELGVLSRVIDEGVKRLAKGGRFAIISFHSLEDRVIKQAFQKWSKGCVCPSNFPVCVCGKKPLVKVITRKPILPSKAEVEQNPRARSAKLRIAERL